MLIDVRPPIANQPFVADRAELDAAAKISPSPVTFELITTRAGFDALEDDWNALFDRAARGVHVFQTFNWNWHWANHFLADDDGDAGGVRLSIVVGRRDGRLVTVWPLVKQKVRGVTQIFWMGEPVSQYGDVLVDDAPDTLEILEHAWMFLKERVRGDLLRLRRVRADASIAPLLLRSDAVVTDRQAAPFLDLASAKSFGAYEERYSPRSRRNRRRLARRLAEQGEMAFQHLAGGEAARKLALKALELKAHWLKDSGLVSNALADPRTTAFFADAAEAKEKSTNCLVSALHVGGEPAALEVSFACKGRLAMHVIVFDLKFEKSGAGVLRLEQSLRDGYEHGLDTYDMLAPGDSYKLDWADGTVEVLDYAKAQSFAGELYARVYLGFVRPRGKAMMKAMPQALRRAVSGSYALAAAVSI